MEAEVATSEVAGVTVRVSWGGSGGSFSDISWLLGGGGGGGLWE